MGLWVDQRRVSLALLEISEAVRGRDLSISFSAPFSGH